MDSSKAARAPSQSPWLRATQPASRRSARTCSSDVCPISIACISLRRDPAVKARGTSTVYDAGVAYDEALAQRIRDLVAGIPDLSEKKMFGGLAFLVGGNMAIAAS